MNTIGLIGAMDEEVAILKEQMTDTKEMTKAGMTFVEGKSVGTENRCCRKRHWESKYGSLHADPD